MEKLEEAEQKSIPVKKHPQIIPAIEEEGKQKLLKQTAKVYEEQYVLLLLILYLIRFLIPYMCFKSLMDRIRSK